MGISLWAKPNEAELNQVKSPKRMLEEQADLFNQNNKVGIVCEIPVSFEKETFGWLEMVNSPLAETKDIEQDCVAKMKLSVAALGKYSIVVLAAKYKVSSLYPCEIKNVLEDDDWEKCQDQKEFADKMKDILSSESMSKLLTNLLVQLQER